MQEFTTSPPPDALNQARQDLAQVKDIMVHNVEQILSRGERIELLVDKTDTMAGQAWAFRRGARSVRRQQFWRNQKILMLSIAVGFVSDSDISGLVEWALTTVWFLVVILCLYRSVLRYWVEPLPKLRWSPVLMLFLYLSLSLSSFPLNLPILLHIRFFD